VCRKNGGLDSPGGRKSLDSGYRGRLYAPPVPRSGRPNLLQAVVGAGFTVAGTLHFTHTRVYERIMPPYVPRHRDAVLVSGVAEVAGGLGVLVPATRPAARWGLLALLVAVFPANVQMALEPEKFSGIPAWALWLRLPLQGVFGWLVWRATAEA
jgi:uncharacterized membrane protein